LGDDCIFSGDACVAILVIFAKSITYLHFWTRGLPGMSCLSS
jgi:hypothetical protein